MQPLSPYPILPIVLIALVVMWVMAKILRINPAKGRFAPIDGLRGYMAFFVFLHHCSIWFFYVHGYGWGPPPSYLYDHLGPTSVCVFFMITAFLFFTKLLQAREGVIDWLRLYLSRLLRIIPLYSFSMLSLFIIVGLLSHFILREPFTHLVFGMMKWLAFIQTDLNGIIATWRIVAGVVWSLAFEWMFYCALPFLGLLFRIPASWQVLGPALIGLIFFILIIDAFYPAAGLARSFPFLGGMLAAFLARNRRVRDWASNSVVSIVIVVLVVMITVFFPTVYTPVPLILMTVAFTAIACGNDLFGILTLPVSRILGQISYSIYLLHGIILFVTFRWGWGFERAGRLSPIEHWLVCSGCAAVLVVVSSLTYRWIERPCQDAAPLLAEKLRK